MPDTKGHILYDPIYMNYPEYVIPQTENRLMVIWDWERRVGIEKDTQRMIHERNKMDKLDFHQN